MGLGLSPPIGDGILRCSARTPSRLRGGFVEDAYDFDAGFFGINPREALAMDPQQRLTLQVAWEALEDARLNPAELRGQDVGVFSGVMYQDYGTLVGEAADMRDYLSVGGSNSVVSGRVSYTLGFRGPPCRSTPRAVPPSSRCIWRCPL